MYQNIRYDVFTCLHVNRGLIGAARQGMAARPRTATATRSPFTSPPGHCSSAPAERLQRARVRPRRLPSRVALPVAAQPRCMAGWPCPALPGGFCATVSLHGLPAGAGLHSSASFPVAVSSPVRACRGRTAARRRRPWACLRGSMACPATEVSCSPSWAHVSAFIELAMIVHKNLYKLSLTQTVYVVG